LTFEFNISVILETHIKPGIKEHAEYVILQLSKMKEDFLRHKSRLAVVRTEIEAKQLFHEKIYNDESEPNKEVPDSISDTISIADSISSRTSQLSIASRYLYIFLIHLYYIYEVHLVFIYNLISIYKLKNM